MQQRSRRRTRPARRRSRWAGTRSRCSPDPALLRSLAPPRRQDRELRSTKRFASGAPLVRVGEAASVFYVIIDGEVRDEVPGRPVVLRTRNLFGEMALIDGEPRSATVVAVGEVYVLMLPRAKFLKALEAEPKIALAIMATLTGRLRALQTATA